MPQIGMCAEGCHIINPDEEHALCWDHKNKWNYRHVTTAEIAEITKFLVVHSENLKPEETLAWLSKLTARMVRRSSG